MNYLQLAKRGLGVCVCALFIGCQSRSSSALAVPPDSVAEVTPCLHQTTTLATSAQSKVQPPVMADTARPAALQSSGHRPITSEEVIAWSLRGTRDETIIDRIECSGAAFHLSTSDELRLREAGVSDDVVKAMKTTAAN